MKPTLRTMRGFTLVETIMVIVLTSLIALVIAPVLAVSVEAMAQRTARLELEESSRLAVARMSREMRRLRNDVSVVNSDNGVYDYFDNVNIRQRFHRVGTTLMRGVFDPITTATTDFGLADNVTALRFDYFDDGGVLIANPISNLGTPTRIRGIRVRMTFQSGNNMLPVEFWVYPKNLRHDGYDFP